MTHLTSQSPGGGGGESAKRGALRWDRDVKCPGNSLLLVCVCVCVCVFVCVLLDVTMNSISSGMSMKSTKR